MTQTVTTIKAELATRLQKAGATEALRIAALEAHWDQRVTTGLAAANVLVNSILKGRGYTTAQVAAWEMLDTVVMDQTHYEIFKAMQGDYFTWDQIKSWDWTKRLEDVVIVTASTGEVTPEGDEGSVSGGDLDDGVHPTVLNDTDASYGD